MRSHLLFEGLPSPPPKTRTLTSRAKSTAKPKPRSAASIFESKRAHFALANTDPSGLTTVEKAGAAAQGVAKGLAVGLGAELAIGFVAGATGMAASTILWLLLPVPIYAIATRWGKIKARARRLCVGRGTLHDYEAAGEVACGLLSIGAAGSGTDSGIESAKAVGEAFGALCGNESQDRRKEPLEKSYDQGGNSEKLHGLVLLEIDQTYSRV